MVEILGESLSLILLIAEVVLAIAEAMVPGAHIIVLGLALIVAGLVGLALGPLVPGGVLAVCAYVTADTPVLKCRAALLGTFDGTVTELADENGTSDTIHADHHRSLTESRAGVDPRLKSC